MASAENITTAISGTVGAASVEALCASANVAKGRNYIEITVDPTAANSTARLYVFAVQRGQGDPGLSNAECTFVIPSGGMYAAEIGEGVEHWGISSSGNLNFTVTQYTR